MSAQSNLTVGVASADERQLFVRIFAVCILVWAVDFKSSTSGGGAAIQGAILAIYAMSSFFLLISGLRQGFGAGPLWILLTALLVFVVESSVTGYLNGQKVYAIFVNVLPPAIYASAAVITYMTLTASEDNPLAFLRLLRYACLIFVVVHLVVVIANRGSINLAESRYEVLSGATTPALAIVAVGFLIRLSRMDVAVLILNLLISALSVTRTLILILATQIGSVMAVRPSTLFKPSTFKGVGVFAVAMSLILALDLAAGTGVTSRWVQRLTVTRTAGADPTALTRRAEVRFMLDAFFRTPETIVFGNGLAALTSLTGPEAAMARRLVGAASVSLHDVGFGHENYVSILFIGGVLGGGGLLIMVFLNGGQALLFIRQSKNRGAEKSDDAEVHIGLWGSLIVMGTLMTGFYSGTLADRDACLWYGIGTGMLYWARGRKTTLSQV